MVLALVIALIAFVVLEIVQAICFSRVVSQNHELSKLLASRNLTEYSLSEARLSGTRPEQKSPDPSYEATWEEEDT